MPSSGVPTKDRRNMDVSKNEDTVAIVKRFFEAIDRLIADKVIRGFKTFTTRYGINRENMVTMKRTLSSFGQFRPAYLAYLVKDYKVSPYWLLLGEGDFYIAGFDAEIVKKLNENCKKK